MKVRVLFFASVCLITSVRAQSDPTIASAQQVLKEQGFYYGEASGKKDADTVAAIRRYQIRNGLQITGDLNAETQKSLGVKGTIAPPTHATPAPTPRVVTKPPPAEVPNERPIAREPARAPNEGFSQPPPVTTSMAALFAGTPFARASFETQRQVVANVQALLARRGYYHDLIDGVFGEGTAFALSAYQSRFGIPTNGRLDSETLAALGLLPGQKAPGLTAPTRRSWHRPANAVAPIGERIYEPR